MSLYNEMFGVRPSVFFILPMLGKHPDEYPRFRDCFTMDEEHPEYRDHIHVYTRTGGGNRENYAVENAVIQSMDGYVTDFDDSFDSTFASWIFTVPEKWANDYKKIKEGTFKLVSKDYQNVIKQVYPKLADKVDEIFST